MKNINDSNEKKKEKKTRSWTKEDKELLVELYPEKSNIELCEILEKTDGQLRWMKSKLGLNTKFKPFTEEEKERIKNYYLEHKDDLDLCMLSKEMNRQKTSISRYARKIGLTDICRKNTEESIKKSKIGLQNYYKTEAGKQAKVKAKELLSYYAKNKHPKGMLNKHHSADTRKRMSESHIELSKNMAYEEKHQIAMKAVKTKRDKGIIHTGENAYSRCKGGHRKDIDHYFRSSWEANIARLLNFKSIKWEYEYKRFNFENEIEGVLSYQPDFYLPEYNIWIEVKGWMDDKSKKRLELFKIYYPDEYKNFILIDQKYYYSLEKEYSNIIENWETKNNYLNKTRKISAA